MARTFNVWEAGTFSAGDQVRYNGLAYETRNDLTSANVTNPQDDTDNWFVIGVLRIQDYNSLQEAMRLELNVDDDMITNSIPLFIQLAEESFEKRIRAPIQRTRRILTVDSESKVEVPSDLLQVINIRLNEDSTGGDSIFFRGGTEILAGNYEEYKDLQRYYRSNIGFSSQRAIPTNYEAPVYWYDDASFWIAPNIDEDTEVELYYYSQIPQLGTTVLLVDANGDPINSDDQTEVEWVADGNAAVDFVQATEIVTDNWFITAAPQMLLYGALLNADIFLHDDPRVALWEAKFARAEAETMELISKFEEGRHHTIQIYNAYTI